MSRLANEVAALERELADLKNRRPFGNVVLRKRDGFERGVNISVYAYGPTSVAEFPRYQEEVFGVQSRCSNAYVTPKVVTYHNTGQRDIWGRQVLEEA